MKSEHDNSHEFTPEAAIRVQSLCASLFDDVISDDELNELNRFLNRHSDARQLYLRCVLLNKLLLGSVSQQQQLQAEQLGLHIDAVDCVTDGENEDRVLDRLRQPDESCPVPIVAIEARRRWGLTIAWVVAASLLLAATAFWWSGNARTDSSISQDRVVATTDPDRKTADQERQPPSPLKISVSYVSKAVAWQNSSDLPTAASLIASESSLQLDDGEVELTYPCGTKLLLVGPADFLAGESGGKLFRGGLVASVTKAGHGFTIETPNGKVVDLGTEFGVAVDDFGISEVGVFKGKVEAFPLKNGRSTETIELNKGDGVQWDDFAVVSMDADLRKFASSVLGRHLPVDLLKNHSTTVDLFRNASIDASKWTTLGAVKGSANGLTMRGQGDAGQRPYLVSKQQFDPLQGPVTITCDVRFSEIGSNGPQMFSVLSRSDHERGVALEPWRGTLASCVRCGFGSNETAGDGLLTAGVKLESDREIASLSLDKFPSLKPNTRYRIVMHDDGVNVSFTVSLSDQPSIKKTVKCRTLFRAKHNYIALEGSVTGSTIIDRVEISQDQSAAKISSYAEFSSLLQQDPAQRQIEQEQLTRLAPSDAKLILQDDFETDELDTTKWRSLGELSLLNGTVQLGVPNKEGRIDTWHARPYLLTRDSLSTTDGPLTIVGKATFADNFLAGYGGSFAVMTRANDELGSGPGWENSVLERGARANFWPAAWNTKHNLEIHEKPSANTISLLATKGVQVDPKSQVYLFRVVDDGNNVSLTLIDPRNMTQEMEVISATSIPMLQGHVAFESCWGSPVTLDDVRIYQSKPVSK